MHRRSQESAEGGMAMITAVLFMMITTVMAASALTFSQHALNTTAVDRKRTQSIGAAEAGIDMMLPALSGITPPCSAASALGTGPTQSSYSVTVTYYNSTGTALTCNPGSGPAGNPTSALIVSTGTTNAAVYGKRTMQALVRLTAVTGGFGDAIFANGPLTVSNQMTVNGNGANNANIYTNTSYTCANNEMVYGSVYAQGDIVASNTCSAAGDWWAKGSISATGNGVLGGSVYAAGDTTGSPGTISVSSNWTVAGNAVAKGAISPTPCGVGQPIAGTCSAYGAPGDPPSQTFPVFDWDSGAWTAGGFTIVDDRGQCSLPSSKLYMDLQNMATSTIPTVFLADCTVNWAIGGPTTWKFNTDVAVWSSAGMSTSNSVTVQSKTSAPHRFFMIVPYHVFGTTTAVTAPCDIAFTNRTAIGGPVFPLNVFVYTPCNLTINNNQVLTGQLYAGGAVTINNHYSMDYSQVTPLGNAVGGSLTGYTVALEYLREVVGP